MLGFFEIFEKFENNCLSFFLIFFFRNFELGMCNLFFVFIVLEYFLGFVNFKLYCDKVVLLIKLFVFG